jgi:hypothetical protein
MKQGDILRIDPKPATEVLYERGSLVVCYACGKPLYRLQSSIYAGEPMARTAWKYAPIEPKDILDLMTRNDLDAGQIAALKAQTLDDWRTHCESIPTLKPGSFADCPSCKASFVYTQTRQKDDGPSSFADRGYLILLAVIPPAGRARQVIH